MDSRGAPDSLIVFMKLWDRKETVGQLKGQALWDWVYHCLDQVLCPKPYRDCKTHNPCSKTGIEHLDRNGAYRTDGDLGLNIYDSNFNELGLWRDHEDLIQALFKQVAGVFKVASESPNNCFQFNIGTEVRFLCNVGSRVRVHESYIGSTLDVVISINGFTPGGRFDCDSTKEGAVGFLKHNTIGDFLADFKGAIAAWGSQIECTSNDAT